MTITLTREEVQNVLDALQCATPPTFSAKIVEDWQSAIETLRTRLAQPEPETCGYDETTGNCTQNPCCYPAPPQLEPSVEPVAWFTEDHREDKSATTYSKKMAGRWKEKGWPVTPLYTAPPQRKEWQGLTDEEVMSLLPGAVRLPPGWADTARAIEAALRSKNT